MLLWSGQLVSWLGSEVSGIVMPLIVLALTGSPAQAGTVAAIRGLVYVVWAIPAGLVIDHLDRRRVMFVANLGSGLAMGSIALALYLQRLTIGQLLFASAVEGSCFVFANLGRFAALNRVVTREDFPAAAARTSTADQLALLVGPPLGGLLYQSVGAFLAVLIDTLSYVVNAVAIFLINTPLKEETARERRAIRHELTAGIVWLWGQPVLRFLNLVTAGRTTIAAGLYLLVVVIAKEQQASSLSIGAIFAFGSAGGILGSFAAVPIHRRWRMWQLLLGINALSLMIFASYAFASNTFLLAAVTALFSFIDPLYVLTGSTYAANIIPDAIRGRVSSLTRLVVLGAHSFGFFITGLLLQYGGSRWAVAALSGVLVVVLVGTALNRRIAQV